MPRSCSVCSHPESAEITKAILAGASNREVVRRFAPGVTESGAQRHRRNCLKAPRREPKRKGRTRVTPAGVGAVRRFDSDVEISSPSDLLEHLKGLFRLNDLLESALERGDVDAAVKVGREIRSTCETFARVAGRLVDGGVQVNVDQRRQGLLMLGKMDEESLRTAIARLTAGGDAAVSAESITASLDVEHRVVVP